MKDGVYKYRTVTLEWTEQGDWERACSLTVSSFWHESVPVTEIIAETARARGVPEERITQASARLGAGGEIRVDSASATAKASPALEQS